MNCVIIDDDEMSRLTLKHLVSQVEFLTMSKEFDSPVEAINYIKNNNVDLVFLDIVMPGLSGLELLETVRDMPQVILTSCRKDFALEAFEHHVTDYLVKPITYQRFLKSVVKAQEVYSKEMQVLADSIYIKSGSKIIKLHLNQILFVEGAADYVEVYTETEKHLVHTSLKVLEYKLPANFVRIHKSFIINLQKIDVIEDFTITVKDPISRVRKEISVGASYKQSFIQKLKIL
jgi:DNA-binding LytR/AlgR family response regulator